MFYDWLIFRFVSMFIPPLIMTAPHLATHPEFLWYPICATTSFLHWWRFDEFGWRRKLDRFATTGMFVTLPWFVVQKCPCQTTLAIFFACWVWVGACYVLNKDRGLPGALLHISLHFAVHIACVPYALCVIATK